MTDQPPLPTRDSLSDMSAEDRPPPPQAPTPRDQPPGKEPTVCLRQTSRRPPPQSRMSPLHPRTTIRCSPLRLISTPHRGRTPSRPISSGVYIHPRRHRHRQAGGEVHRAQSRGAVQAPCAARCGGLCRGVGCGARARGAAAGGLRGLPFGLPLRYLRPDWRILSVRTVFHLFHLPGCNALKQRSVGAKWTDKPDNNLLRFLLRYRLPQKYGAVAEELKPGHPVYDELAAGFRRQL